MNAKICSEITGYNKYGLLGMACVLLHKSEAFALTLLFGQCGEGPWIIPK